MTDPRLPCRSPASAGPAAEAAPRSALSACLLILGAEIDRNRLMLARYPTEASAGLLVFGFMFVVFAVIGKVTEGPFAFFSGNLSAMATLYTLWVVVSTTVGAGATQIGGDAAIGVLENLFLSAAPVTRILAMRAVASLCQGLLLGAVLLAAFCMGTRWLPSASVFLALGTVLAAYSLSSIGLSLAFCGAALLSKRVSTMMLPVNFLGIAAILGHHASGPVQAGDGWLYLPFVAGATAVRMAIEQGVVDPTLCGIALASAVPCCVCGCLVLRKCAMACRRSGTTNVY